MLSYKNDYGILNDKYAKYSDRYSAQMRKYELDLRMNIDIDITPSTLAQLTMLGSLRERKRPATYEGNLFQGLFNTPSGALNTALLSYATATSALSPGVSDDKSCRILMSACNILGFSLK